MGPNGGPEGLRIWGYVERYSLGIIERESNRENTQMIVLVVELLIVAIQDVNTVINEIFQSDMADESTNDDTSDGVQPGVAMLWNEAEKQIPHISS